MESGYTVLEVKYDTGMARIYDHISNESRYISISTVKQLYKSGVLVNGVVEDSIGRIRLSPVCSAEDLDIMDKLAKELYIVIPVNKGCSSNNARRHLAIKVSAYVSKFNKTQKNKCLSWVEHVG